MKKKHKPQRPHMEPFLFFLFFLLFFIEPFLLLNCAWTVVVRRDAMKRIFFYLTNIFKKYF
jgi:hypothetical protein